MHKKLWCWEDVERPAARSWLIYSPIQSQSEFCQNIKNQKYQHNKPNQRTCVCVMYMMWSQWSNSTTVCQADKLIRQSLCHCHVLVGCSQSEATLSQLFLLSLHVHRFFYIIIFFPFHTILSLPHMLYFRKVEWLVNEKWVALNCWEPPVTVPPLCLARTTTHFFSSLCLYGFSCWQPSAACLAAVSQDSDFNAINAHLLLLWLPRWVTPIAGVLFC